MKLKKLVFCVYFLFFIFPMDIKGQETEVSTSNNYIIIKYSNTMDTQVYENGFSIDEIPSRKGVNYIIKGNSRYKSDEPLTIEPNDSIEIQFYDDITSLENFFDSLVDYICTNIISIDLSHFNSSLVENTEQMFINCFNLEKINFTNFNTSSVTNMGYMFAGCSSLKFLDLSNFNTSSVTNM